MSLHHDFQHVVVALDLRQRSDGALRFASWLQAERLKVGHGNVQMSGLHVIEPEHVAHLRDIATYDNLIFDAQRNLMELAERIGGDSLFHQMRVLDGGEVAARLIAYVREVDTDLLIIGRVASVDGQAIHRLGKVARHLLRHLAVPTLVVPPDLWEYEIGQGPVVVAIDGTDKSLPAVNFARWLAQSIGRDAVAVHVINAPGYWACGTFAAHLVAPAMAEVRAKAESTLAKWADDRVLTDLRVIFAEGSTCHEILRVAQELSACALVAGSRRLSTIERFFISSVGSQLAANAKIPVAIVPSSPAHADHDNLAPPTMTESAQHHPS